MDGITNSVDMGLSKLREMVKPGMLQFVGSKRVRHDLATEQQDTVPTPRSSFILVLFGLEIPGSHTGLLVVAVRGESRLMGTSSKQEPS